MITTTAPFIEGHELKELGFVHVTNLTVVRPTGMTVGQRKINPSPLNYGTWGRNNVGHFVVVTQTGKVWLGDAEISVSEETLAQLCPKGNKGFTTTSLVCVHITERVEDHSLFLRYVDPAWEPPEVCQPIPR